jgi:riboflavin kinase/FMN adenylyltransferase
MAAHIPILLPHPLDEIPAGLTGGVVAIGNFDGVHRGHAAVLGAALAEARRRGLPAVALTFEPHPRTVFRPEAPVFRLTPLPAKARLVAALGLDGIVVAHFDRDFSSLAPKAFVESVIVERLKAREVAVGRDFRFAKGRAGSSDTLRAAGAAHGFTIVLVDPVADPAGVRFGSSMVRDALARGDIVGANALLGYRWFVTGEVVAGDRRGRGLGYPTANLRLSPDCRLRQGIYAVRFKRRDGVTLDGVASYGRRPTFDNGPPMLETFVFDFSGDLYGEEVTVTFIDWIRPEERFATVEALIEQMGRDSAAARAKLAAAGPGSALDRALDALV